MSLQVDEGVGAATGYATANLSWQQTCAPVSGSATPDGAGSTKGRWGMADDWVAVGEAVTARLDELGMTQLELAAKSRVSPATIRELQYNKLPRRRHPRTLEAISTALEWPAEYLSDIVTGKKAKPHADESDDPVLGALDDIHGQLREIKARLADVERRLADEDGPAGD
jgi:transcriptional regulator with XRE-family HTH domain